MTTPDDAERRIFETWYNATYVHPHAMKTSPSWEAWQASRADMLADMRTLVESALLSCSYITYVKEHSPTLHRLADGTPSIEHMVKEALAHHAAKYGDGR